MATGKLQNWNKSIELDYLSMYTKTWFAFLCSLQELYPIVTEQIKQEKKGDKPLIKKYIDNISVPSNYDTIRPYIEKVHLIGTEILKREIPDFYLGRYFKVNSTYSYEGNTTGNIEYKISYKKIDNQPGIFIYYKSTNRKFFNDIQKYVIECNISLKEVIEAHNQDNKEEIIDYVGSQLDADMIDYIDNNFPRNIRTSGKESRKGYLRGILSTILQNWRQNFEAEEIFEPLPFKNFKLNAYNVNNNQIPILIWFVNFNYALRNILFHYIINPFDDKWIELFKNTFFALKEIVNHNLTLIASTSTSSTP